MPCSIVRLRRRRGNEPASTTRASEWAEKKYNNIELKNPYVNHADWNAIWTSTAWRRRRWWWWWCCALWIATALHGFSIKFELYAAKENEFVSGEKKETKLKWNLIYETYFYVNKNSNVWIKIPCAANDENDCRKAVANDFTKMRTFQIDCTSRTTKLWRFRQKNFFFFFFFFLSNQTNLHAFSENWLIKKTTKQHIYGITTSTRQKTHMSISPISIKINFRSITTQHKIFDLLCCLGQSSVQIKSGMMKEAITTTTTVATMQHQTEWTTRQWKKTFILKKKIPWQIFPLAACVFEAPAAITMFLDYGTKMNLC